MRCFRIPSGVLRKNLIRAHKLYGSMPPAPFVRCCLDVVGCVSNSYVPPDRMFRLGRRNDFSVPASAIFVSSRRRESVSAQTTRHVHGAKTKAPTGDRFGSFHSRSTYQVFRLAIGPHCRQTRHVDPMAPKRLPAILEVEISSEWPSQDSGRSPKLDWRDGNEQSDLGRGTNHQ